MLTKQPVSQLIIVLLGCLFSVGALFGFVNWMLSQSSLSKLFFVTLSIIALFNWGFYIIQRSIGRNNPYTDQITALLIFIIFIFVSLYNPMEFNEMWVFLLFFPMFINLLGNHQVSVVWSIVFVGYFIIFNVLDPSYQGFDEQVQLFMIISRSLFGIGSLLLGLMILHVFKQNTENIGELYFQKQKKQIINILHSFIPVVERKTQTSREEIDEMSFLLKRLINKYGLRDIQDWKIDLLCLLHFVSRVKLPDYLFEKEGKLTEFEFNVVEEHCYMAEEILSGVPELNEIKEIFLYHHERIDGRGYPYQLSGDQVPIFSQMLGIVEVYLALTTPRSYRPAISQEKAYAEIMKESGIAYREDILKAFGEVIKQDTHNVSKTLLRFDQIHA